jgi:hypothetical protein
MKRVKFAQKATNTEQTEPFQSAEEAWFWCWSCLIAREEGARFSAGLGLASRPCEPDDLIISARRLISNGKLTRKHVATITEFGRKQTPPNPRNSREVTSSKFWEEALD